MSKQKKKFLILPSGARYEVTDENGKYYVCGDIRFRKMNPMIVDVVEEVIKEEKKEEDGMVENIEKAIEKKEAEKSSNGRKKAAEKKEEKEGE